MTWRDAAGVNLTSPSINEGGIATLTGSISDPGSSDTFTLVVNWGDGRAVAVELLAGSFSLTHQYLNNISGSPGSTFAVVLMAVDDDGLASTNNTATITVNNVPPTVAGLATTPGSINENGMTVLTGTISDPAHGTLSPW